MTQPTVHASIPSSKEEMYFLAKQAELLSQRKAARDRKAELEKLAADTGIANEQVLETLHDWGYTSETINLLPFVPLVQVAWASGNVSENERQVLLELAESRGITMGSAAWKKLDAWLNERPSHEFFQRTLRVLRYLVEHVDQNHERFGEPGDLLQYCLRVATASGGFLGIGNKVCAGEQQALDQIAAELMCQSPVTANELAITH